jgi:hypothetical protein
VHLHAFVIAILTGTLAAAQQTPLQGDPTALTIYNNDFAVVRTTVNLKLRPGLNDVTATQVTTQIEPDSVVLREQSRPSSSGGNSSFHILEQNYDPGVATQEGMLRNFEGESLDFQLPAAGANACAGCASQPVSTRIVKGKVLRAGGDGEQPLLEVDGKIQFQLPGLPLFPADTGGLLFKPALHWRIQSGKAQSLQAELAYLTGGLSWQATYNVITSDAASVAGDQRADILGWVTINNQSGSDFPAARIKLMAGNVARIQPEARPFAKRQLMAFAAAGNASMEDTVTQKTFDDFHLYDLHRTVQLREGETKQIQFFNASEVPITRTYLYDGAMQNLPAVRVDQANLDEEYGLDAANTRVHILQQFKNTSANHLGMPLPSGRLRVYRRDTDGQIEFIGENLIPHTPAEGNIKIVTGDAFDIQGARTQTNFRANSNGRTLDEAFQIKLTNQKDQPVTVTVVERLYRGANWKITGKSTPYTKTDSHTIQFPLQVPAKGESTLAYSVRYTW